MNLESQYYCLSLCIEAKYECDKEIKDTQCYFKATHTRAKKSSCGGATQSANTAKGQITHVSKLIPRTYSNTVNELHSTYQSLTVYFSCILSLIIIKWAQTDIKDQIPACYCTLIHIALLSIRAPILCTAWQCSIKMSYQKYISTLNNCTEIHYYKAPKCNNCFTFFQQLLFFKCGTNSCVNRDRG